MDAQVNADLVCPSCGYCLRGLVEPRCPECGRTFDPQDLFDPSLASHPYLFEHHPEKGKRSFFSTLVGGFRPALFWSRLRPTQPQYPKRLFIYWMLVSLIYLVGPALYIAAYTTIISRGRWVNMELNKADWLRILSDPAKQPVDFHNYPTTQAYIEGTFPHNRLTIALTSLLFVPLEPEIQDLVAFGPIWPLGTLLYLLLLEANSRAAGLQRFHVARCVIYSFDVIAWLAIVDVAAFVATFILGASGIGAWLLLGGAAISLATAIYRLTVAYRLYLGVRPPLATFLCSQLVLLVLWSGTMLVLHGPANWPSLPGPGRTWP